MAEKVIPQEWADWNDDGKVDVRDHVYKQDEDQKRSAREFTKNNPHLFVDSETSEPPEVGWFDTLFANLLIKCSFSTSLIASCPFLIP